MCWWMGVEAVKYLDVHPVPVESVEFDKSCGVGAFVSVYSFALCSYWTQDSVLQQKSSLYE